MDINILFSSYGVKPNGGFLIAYRYANELAKRGHRINLIHTPSIRSLPVRFYKWIAAFLKMRSAKNLWFHFEENVNRKYCFSLREKNIPDADITMATTWQTAVILNGYTPKKGRKFYLIQGYETWFGHKEEVDTTWHYNMTKIVISQWLLKLGENMGCRDLHYIPNALDGKKYGVYSDPYSREKIITMNYAKEEFKGSRDGVEAMKLARKQIPVLRCVAFGKDKRPSHLPDWIEYHENPAQDFLVKQIYNRSYIYLCTSWQEGWGLPPMEAMACGSAVITTDNGGVRDFAIDGENALYCKMKDPRDMAEKIIALHEDKSLHDRLVRSGLEKIPQFSWDRSVQLLEKLFLS
ncbi:MAG: glycosyltransferase family 4 protein [Fibrobacter sp.]|jgi:glycosyltransferase involved in cell wall biosynthesis|nr:glycosyltransferase family 4 protein [Fibrobacter sp.]